MPDTSAHDLFFAETMVEKLESAIESAAGAKTVTFDGTVIAYDDLLTQYDYWKKRLARYNGTRPRVAQINLGRAW